LYDLASVWVKASPDIFFTHPANRVGFIFHPRLFVKNSIREERKR